MTKHQNIEKIIGTKISNERLLRQALTHPSFFGNKKATSSGIYERLEFLGDAVLNLIVANYVFDHHPRTAEGKMTKLRSALVNKKTLARVFDNLQLLPFINMREEFLYRPLQTTESSSLKADIIEALIAVIYKNQGQKSAEAFVKKHILCLLPAVLKNKLYENPINQLQERIAKLHKKNPRYKLVKQSISENGAAHFEVKVYFKQKLLGTGVGSSKKSASLAAAHEAMENINTARDALALS